MKTWTILATSAALSMSAPVLADKNTDKSSDESIQQDMAQAYEDAKSATVDAYITGRLITAYALSEHLKATDIHVDVQERKAILSGEVGNEIQRDLAVEIARGVEGLEDVESTLQITERDQAEMANTESGGFAQHFNDAAIKARVKTRLLWNSNVSGLSIDVNAEQGEVTLSGAVDSQEQAALAIAITENTDGVAKVVDELKVQTASRES